MLRGRRAAKVETRYNSDHPNRSCEQANVLAAQQLEAVTVKIRQLQALRAELKRMVDSACRGQAADCRVIEVLSDHALCKHHEPDARRS